MKYIILFLILFSKFCNAQFNYVSESFGYSNGDFTDSSFFYSYSASGNQYFIYNLNKTPIDTITKFPPFTCSNYSLKSFSMYNMDIFSIQIKECTPSVFENYLSENSGALYNKIKLPNGLSGGFSNFDNIGKIFYSSDPYSGKRYLYSYSLANKKWDSVSHYPLALLPLKLSNNRGFFWELDTTTGKSKIGRTNDGIKTFQILNNIDYTKVPLNNSINLKNLVIINDSFWLINYSDNNLTINGAYLSNDLGYSWKKILNENIISIVTAGDSNAYINSVPYSSTVKSNLYQISNRGERVCLTNFHNKIKSMKFENVSKGFILAIDDNTSQIGIWKMVNGGGSPCYVQNVGIKNNKDSYNAIRIFPNPANNQITLANYSLPVHSNYQIYNLLGTLVQQGNLKEKETTININTLADGLYFIRVGDTTLKFVKGKD